MTGIIRVAPAFIVLILCLYVGLLAGFTAASAAKAARAEQDVVAVRRSYTTTNTPKVDLHNSGTGARARQLKERRFREMLELGRQASEDPEIRAFLQGLRADLVLDGDQK
jgi:hypothetical protein